MAGQTHNYFLLSLTLRGRAFGLDRINVRYLKIQQLVEFNNDKTSAVVTGCPKYQFWGSEVN